MYSFSFPNMLGNSSSNMQSDKAAIRTNLQLLLNTERASLFGDPYFGTSLRKSLFEQSTAIVSDLLIDEIYTAIITFIPQVALDRKNITLYTDGKALYCEIYLTYLLDNTSDLYVIKMTESDDE